MNTINSLGLTVFSDDLSTIKLENSGAKSLNTISPNSYGISTKDPVFEKALQDSDFLVLDGVYFALASILLKGKNIRKNQGPDVFYHFMERLNEQSGKVFFLGATEAILQKIRNRANREYPNVTVSTYSPPFKDSFSIDDSEAMIQAINSFSPDVLFVGMTCPKQEKWVFLHKSQINAKLVACIGAVFDWYAGNQKEIHPLWWTLRLAWLKRTIDRPEILKRYPNIGIFFKDLFLIRLGLKDIKPKQEN